MPISEVCPRFLRPAMLLCALSALMAADHRPSTLTLTVLSGRPEFVSGGSALVEIKDVVPGHKLQVKANGHDVTAAFQPDLTRGSIVGLVEGLKNGNNTVVAKAGSKSGTLQL